jgi:hypothetical protein
MIVFGHNNFRMRSIIPSSIGLPPEYDAYDIEVRQRYAHIFWIPLFPIGKIWGLRKKADNQLYEMPAAVRLHVQQNTRIPSVSVWAFSGLLLVGLIGIIAMISNYVSEVQNRNAMKEYYKKEYADKMAMAQQPQRGDVYEFMDKDSYRSDKYMVDSVGADKTMFLVQLDDGRRTDHTIRLSQADVKNYLSEEMDYDFKGARLPGGDAKPVVLESVNHGEYVPNLPTFSEEGHADEAAGGR